MTSTRRGVCIPGNAVDRKRDSRGARATAHPLDAASGFHACFASLLDRLSCLYWVVDASLIDASLVSSPDATGTAQEPRMTEHREAIAALLRAARGDYRLYAPGMLRRISRFLRDDTSTLLGFEQIPDLDLLLPHEGVGPSATVEPDCLIRNIDQGAAWEFFARDPGLVERLLAKWRPFGATSLRP